MPDLLTAYDNLIPAWNWAIEQLVSNESEAAIPLLRANFALDDLFDAYNLLTGCHMQLREYEKVPANLNEMEAIATETQQQKLFGVYYVSRS